MDDFNNINKIAVLYFEGKATAKEEETLLEFLKENPQNKKLFRQWEKHWIENHIPDSETERAWNRLRLRIHTQDTQHSNITTRHKMPEIWKYAIAAAITCLVTIAIWNTLYEKNDITFACSTPAGSQTQVTLPDGTTVWLKAASEIKYSSNKKNDYRIVDLQGEADFDVKKHDGSKFIVHTGQYDVTVKGTKFNVSAYKDDETVTTTLIDGSIDINRNNEIMEMKPGEQVVCNKKTGEISKQTSNRNINNWHDNSMELHEVTLRHFARIMSRRYDTDIHIANTETGEIKISAVLQNNESIDEVISALKHITNCKITRRGKTIFIE